MNPYDEPIECCANHSRHIGKQGRQYICRQDNKIDDQKAVNSHESVCCDLYVQQGTFLYAYWYSIWHIVSILCWLLSERNVECSIFLLQLHWSSKLPHCVTATNISMSREKTNGKTGGEKVQEEEFTRLRFQGKTPGIEYMNKCPMSATAGKNDNWRNMYNQTTPLLSSFSLCHNLRSEMLLLSWMNERQWI